MTEYTLQELCTKVDLPVRTVRYYVQIGLIEPPTGETRAARYGDAHAQQLDQIRRWSAAGLSLSRIRELLAQPDADALRHDAPVVGVVQVKSHVQIADGIELVIDAARAALTPQMLRELVDGVAKLHAEIRNSHRKPS